MNKKELNDLLKKCTWQNISIGKYEKIQNNLFDIENVTTETVLDTMSIIYELPKENILDMDVKVFNCLMQGVINLKEFKPDKLRKTYNINDKDYTIGFKYNVFRGCFDIKTDQYISFMNVLKENENDLSAILATILIPKDKRFNKDYDLLELKENINKHMSILDGATIIFF